MRIFISPPPAENWLFYNNRDIWLELPRNWLEKFYSLFIEFNLDLEKIKYLVILIKFLPTMCEYGCYLGKTGDMHFIFINKDLLYRNSDDLNLTIIHELKHLYWNLVNPGNLTGKFIVNEYPEWLLTLKGRSLTVPEEEDCKEVEKKYRNIILLDPPRLAKFIEKMGNKAPEEKVTSRLPPIQLNLFSKNPF